MSNFDDEESEEQQEREAGFHNPEGESGQKPGHNAPIEFPESLPVEQKVESAAKASLEDLKVKFSSLTEAQQLAVYKVVFPNPDAGLEDPNTAIADIKNYKLDAVLKLNLGEFETAVRQVGETKKRKSHKANVPEGAKPFMDRSELPEKVAGWKVDAKNLADTKSNRTEKGSWPPWSGTVGSLHGESFIKKVIPELLAKKQGGKIRILDIGGGQGSFADSVRQEFENKVEVFSTGLAKKEMERKKSDAFISRVRHYELPSLKEGRKYKRIRAQASIDKNDLKWNSVLQLSDFQEFDLAIDTYGEFFYTTNKFLKEEKDESEIVGVDLEAMKRYLSAVCSKLMPGGICSIAPFRFGLKQESEGVETDKEVGKKPLKLAMMPEADIASLDLQAAEKLLEITTGHLREYIDMGRQGKIRTSIRPPVRATRGEKIKKWLNEKILGRYAEEEAVANETDEGKIDHDVWEDRCRKFTDL